MAGGTERPADKAKKKKLINCSKPTARFVASPTTAATAGLGDEERCVPMRDGAEEDPCGDEGMGCEDTQAA